MRTLGVADRALSQCRQLESEVEAKGAALLDIDGAISAKVEAMSERLLRLSSELEVLVFACRGT